MGCALDGSVNPWIIRWAKKMLSEEAEPIGEDPAASNLLPSYNTRLQRTAGNGAMINNLLKSGLLF